MTDQPAPSGDPQIPNPWTLTAAQRDELLRAGTPFAAEPTMRTIEAAFQTLAAQVAALYGALQATGVIDEHGRFLGGTQNDFALCPQPDIAETTADYERLTGHAATCAAGFTDICDCPPARINPASDGADHA